MLELLRQRFLYSLMRAAADGKPTTFYLDPYSRKWRIHQKQGFRVWFTEDEVIRFNSEVRR